MRYTMTESPVGTLLLVGDDEGLRELHMGADQPGLDIPRDDKAFADVVEQLHAYFARDLKEFDVKLAARGTEFQQRVWNALVEIPYGKTASYADIAKRIDKPRATRAVGSANGRNPIAIIVPCHRVIASGGGIGGYAGGLDRKRTLLELETRVARDAIPQVNTVNQMLGSVD